MPSIQFSGGTSGTVIGMLGGYALNAAGDIDPTQNQNTTMSYYATLNGLNFTFQACEYLGMRYFEISNAPMAVTTANFAFIERNSRMNDSASSFTSPNATLNAVWDLMKHSIPMCAQEQFLDTPTREKGAFLGDGALQSIAAMAVEDERVLTRRALGDFILSMGQWWSTPAANVGRMNAVYPNVDNARDIPDYTQSYLVWVWEYYQQSGDLAFLATNYTALTNIAQYVNRSLNPANGLITRILGGTSSSYTNGIIDGGGDTFGYDFNTVRNPGNATTVINGWAWEDYDVVSRVASELGYTADSNTYRAMANALQAAMNTNLLNASGVYVDGLEPDGTQSAHASQHANVFPLSLNIVPAAQQRKRHRPGCAAWHERERAGHPATGARAWRGQPGTGVAESLHQRNPVWLGANPRAGRDFDVGVVELQHWRRQQRVARLGRGGIGWICALHFGCEAADGPV